MQPIEWLIVAVLIVFALCIYDLITIRRDSKAYKLAIDEAVRKASGLVADAEARHAADTKRLLQVTDQNFATFDNRLRVQERKHRPRKGKQ